MIRRILCAIGLHIGKIRSTYRKPPTLCRVGVFICDSCKAVYERQRYTLP